DGDECDISMSEEDGPSPMQPIPHPTLSLALKLAATFGSEDAFIACFGAASSVVVLGNIEPQEVARTQDLLTLILMPPGWIVASEARMLKGEPNALCLLAPEITNGRVAERVLNIFGSDIRTALSLPDRLFVLVPRGCELPPDLQCALPAPVPIAPLSRTIFGEHLRYSHGLVDGKDHAALLERIPDEKALTELPGSVLSAALRAPTARGVVDRLSSATEKLSKRQKPDGPRLEDMDGNSPALQAARQLVADLAAWKEGTCEWSELTRSMILHGPPGTGKTWLARAMGASAGVHFVQASFAEWQSTGHLGDMLAAMRQSFVQAIEKKPAILFIDEIDAAGSRYDTDAHGRSYRRQVINAVLEQIDLLMREEGILLIGACNDVHSLDPAILRPGRFDRKVQVPLPGKAEIAGILRSRLPAEFSLSDIDDLARTAIGMTAADVDAAVRQAKSIARSQNRALEFHDLRKLIGYSHSEADQALDWRIALHECGHAIVATALALGPVTRIMLNPLGGETVTQNRRNQSLLRDVHAGIACLMAGRAAERLVLGEISAGAGGSRQSDLARATNMALQIDQQLGLGAYGPVYRGDADGLALHDPAQRQRVQQRLEQAEALAAEILQKHKLQLEHMAKALVSERELIDPQLSKLLAGIASEPLLLENNMIEPQPVERQTVSTDDTEAAVAHKPSERETNKASNTRDAP
ncbi:AAA family ATPase, partial [Martelella mediterranea]